MGWNKAFCFEFIGKSMETETTLEFPDGEKAIVEQILASEERKKSKRAGLWKSMLGIQVGKLTIWVRSFEIIAEFIIAEFIKSIIPTKIGQPVFMIDIKVSKDKYSRGFNLIYARWNRTKDVHKNEEGDR